MTAVPLPHTHGQTRKFRLTRPLAHSEMVRASSQIKVVLRSVLTRITSERLKPEFSAKTGTRTEIILVRFRFGNTYRNRNGHFTPNSAPKICSKHNDPQSQIKKVGISIILHKNLLYRVISLYYGEKYSQCLLEIH